MGHVTLTLLPTLPTNPIKACIAWQLPFLTLQWKGLLGTDPKAEAEGGLGWCPLGVQELFSHIVGLKA